MPLLAGAVLLLTACEKTTLPYRVDSPSSPHAGGFSEIAIDPTHYRIRVSEPHGTRRAPMESLALRRAAEISLAKGKYGFLVVQRIFADHVYVAGDRRGTVRITYEPGYDAWTSYWRLYRHGLGLPDLRTEPTWILGEGDRSKLRRVEFYLDFELRPGPAPGVYSAIGLLEAQGVRRRVSPAATGASTAPVRAPVSRDAAASPSDNGPN